MISVLHINYSDSFGGAEQFSYDFVHSSILKCNLIVYKKTTTSNRVTELPKNILDHGILFLDKVLYKIGVRKQLKKIFFTGEVYNFTYRKLKNIKEYQQADIIHLHNIHGGYFDLMALEKIALDKPIVWTMHDMWGITGGEAHTFECDNYKRGVAKTPYLNVYPLNNPLIDLRQYYLRKKKKLYNIISKRIVFVPASYWLENCIRESWIYSRNMMIVPIHYGINLSIFKNYFKRDWTIPKILFFNSKSQFKGSDVFEKIISRLSSNCQIYIVGNKFSFHDERITYLSFITDRDKLASLYNSVDILVFPSFADTFPFTILEAMACGVCVIASDTSGIPEQLISGGGILFENKNSLDLLIKLNYYLENIETVRKIGKDASVIATKKYDFMYMHNRYEALYKTLLNK